MRARVSARPEHLNDSLSAIRNRRITELDQCACGFVEREQARQFVIAVVDHGVIREHSGGHLHLVSNGQGAVLMAQRIIEDADYG